jgi:hypothetical protein
MPSSTSSSDRAASQVAAPLPRPGELDRDAYRRPLPALAFAREGLVALLVFVLAVTVWELGWRNYGSEPAIRNSEGLWAAQRRRIDQGEGDRTVIVGSSRVLFDLQLPVWERISGERPIQLALEGTSPVPLMEDLAADPDFTGRLVVGVSPPLLFTGYGYRLGALKRYREETPAQWIGQQLSQHLLEPWLAFLDEDFALFTVLKRQAWPVRPGTRIYQDVRKLSVSEADRNTRMWSKVENDPEYARMAQQIWTQLFQGPPPGPPVDMAAVMEKQIEAAVAAVARLRERGVPVVFVRAPSDADFLAFEQKAFPREVTWDRLIERSGAAGVHFADHPQLQGYRLPEWSHLSASEADRFTAAILPLIERGFAAQQSGASAAGD